MTRTHSLAFAAGGLLAVLLLWALLAYTGLIRPIFLPTPKDVFSSLLTLLFKGSLLADILASVSRILLGFLLSAIVAFPLGIALAISRRTQAFLEPLVAFVRYIPPSAFIPLAILWFGIGEVEKVAILFLGVAPYLALLVADTVLGTRKEFLDAALTLGASKRQLITSIIVPNALPGIWDASRIMIGAGWTFIIIAEIVGASSGLGHLAIESQRFLRTDHVFAVIVVIGLLGLATDAFFQKSYKLLFPWTEKSHA